MDWIRVAEDRVAGSSGHDNETSGFPKGGKLICLPAEGHLMKESLAWI